jgi:glycosyltransferase involved in cell wall biosynthesis
MHVLQLLPSLEVGGVERGVLDLARGLIARGHRVSVVSSGGPLVEPLTRLGAAHHQLPVHKKSPASIWACIPVVAELIRTTGVDVVHARSRVPAWIGFAAARCREPGAALFTNRRVLPPPSARHVVDQDLALPGALGLARPERVEFSLPSDPAAETAIDEFLATSGVKPRDRVVVLNVGAARPAKR